jgi:hypothetical protein
MEHMPVTDSLTTEHIKSHLQKYRLHSNRCVRAPAHHWDACLAWHEYIKNKPTIDRHFISTNRPTSATTLSIHTPADRPSSPPPPKNKPNPPETQPKHTTPPP